MVKTRARGELGAFPLNIPFPLRRPVRLPCGGVRPFPLAV